MRERGRESERERRKVCVWGGGVQATGDGERKEEEGKKNKRGRK